MGGFFLSEENQGDHGKRRANYRCCIPALAGFVSPHSVGPGGGEVTMAEEVAQGAGLNKYRQREIPLRSKGQEQIVSARVTRTTSRSATVLAARC
jgi:hypothetical protein